MDSRTYTPGLERAVIEIAVRSSAMKSADDIAEILECNTSTAREIILRYRVQIAWLRHVNAKDTQPVSDLLHLSYSRDQALRCIGVHTIIEHLARSAEVPKWVAAEIDRLFAMDKFQLGIDALTSDALEVQLESERALAGVF